MKGLKLVLVCVLLFASLVAIVGQVEAATNIYVNGSLPNNTLFQGQVRSINLTIANNENYDVRIYSVGINYDWMKPGTFYTLDMGGNYQQIGANGQLAIGNVPVSCDNTVQLGYHSYYYQVVLTWYNQYMNGWINETVVQPGNVYVDTMSRAQALTYLQNANQTIADAKALNYSSIRANADLANASMTLNDSWNLYYANNFTDAINKTYSIIMDINDAKVGEQFYLDNRSAIDTQISSINDKLKVISGVTSPDAKDFVNLSLSYLNTTQNDIAVENWIDAKKNANLAQQAVDSAANAEFYYRMKPNQTNVDLGPATQLVQAAKAAVQNANSLITTSTAMSILNNATAQLQLANQSLSNGDAMNATVYANVATTLVNQALGEEANNRIAQARQTISGVGTLNSPNAKDMLNQSNDRYTLAKSSYASGDYPSAIDNASQAYKLANDTTAVEQQWNTEHPASPGFEAVYAIAALFIGIGIAGMFARRERKD